MNQNMSSQNALSAHDTKIYLLYPNYGPLQTQRIKITPFDTVLIQQRPVVRVEMHNRRLILV